VSLPLNTIHRQFQIRRHLARDETLAKFCATVPLGRLSTALDVANAVFFLARDEANFTSSACLEVDSGRCV
jgi:3-oxoacyl-[acyl-carrier protein] reductase